VNEKLQSRNVDKEKQTKNAERTLELKLEIENSPLEKLHWKHVHVDPNFPKNVKIVSNQPNLQKDVLEDTIDVQEDVWEKHVPLVQKPLVQHLNLLTNCASANIPEDVEDFIAEEKEESEKKKEKKEDVKEKKKEKKKEEKKEKKNVKENTKLLSTKKSLKEN